MTESFDPAELLDAAATLAGEAALGLSALSYKLADPETKQKFRDLIANPLGFLDKDEEAEPAPAPEPEPEEEDIFAGIFADQNFNERFQGILDRLFNESRDQRDNPPF